MARSRWYAHAASVIRQRLTEAEVQGLDAEATQRLVDAAYPFGERTNHPYRMWLRARRDLLHPANTPDARAVSAQDRAKLAAWNNGEPIRAAEDTEGDTTP
jgi:hypothetical protein